MYGVVNKLKKNKENVCFDDKKDQGQVYAEVQRLSPHGSVFEKFIIFYVSWSKLYKNCFQLQHNIIVTLKTLYNISKFVV